MTDNDEAQGESYEISEREIIEQLSYGRMLALSEMPYFSHGMACLIPYITNDVPTMGVDDSWRLYINPQFVAKLSVQETAAVLLHEFSHVIRVHAARCPGDESSVRDRWNVAGDCEINDSLRGLVAAKLPKDCMLPELFNLPNDQTAEFYYARLPEQEGQGQGQPSQGQGQGQPSQGQGQPSQGQGQGQPGKERGDNPCAGGSATNGKRAPWELDPADPRCPGMNEVDRKLNERRIAKEILDHEASKGIGSTAQWAKRWAEQVFVKPVNWESIRRAAMSQTVPNLGTEWDYGRRNRRYLQTKAVMPALEKRVPTVSVVIDASGSMSQDDLGMALGVIKDLVERCGIKTEDVEMYSATTELMKLGKLKTTSHIDLKQDGGTDMASALEAMEKRRPKTDAVVLITDGETPWPKRKPSYPLLVGIVGDSASPAPAWIKTVPIDKRAESVAKL